MRKTWKIKTVIIVNDHLQSPTSHILVLLSSSAVCAYMLFVLKWNGARWVTRDISLRGRTCFLNECMSGSVRRGNRNCVTTACENITLEILPMWETHYSRYRFSENIVRRSPGRRQELFPSPVVAMTTLRFCYAEQTLVVCPPPLPQFEAAGLVRIFAPLKHIHVQVYTCSHTHTDMLKCIEKTSSLNCGMLYIWVLKL